MGTFGIGGGYYGHIDILVPVRGGSKTTIALNAYSSSMLGQTLKLIIRQSNDDYVYAILSATDGGWIGYDLQVYGQSITIIDGGWATVSGVTMKADWFSSGDVNTSQFGGYPLKVEKLNGYFGFALPDKSRTEWLRTTSRGLIPYQSGGASSLGTSTWPFNSLYVKNAYINGEAALHGPSVTATLSTNGNGGYVRYSVYGDIVVVNVDYYRCTANTTIKVGYIPAAYRPKKEVIGFGYVRGTSSDGQINVGTDGAVGIWCTSTSSSYFAGSVAYTLL